MTDKEVQYSVSVKLSQVEWRIVQRLRAIVKHGYGSVHVDVSTGEVKEVLATTRELHEELKQLQA